MNLKHYAELCRIAYEPNAITQYAKLNYVAALVPTSTSEQVYWLKSGPEGIIVIAGTNDASDWLVNLLAMPLGGGTPWDVHPGFAAIAVALYPKVKATIDTAELTIVGHSKGAAVAALLGPMFNCQVVAFGSPRIGSQEFADSYPSDNYLRVVNPQDIVARIPSRLAGYRHCGQPVVYHEGEWLYSEAEWERLKEEYPMWKLFLSLVGSIMQHFSYWK